MKKSMVILCAVVLLLGTAGISGATLSDRGGGLIYDEDQDITWLQYANYAYTSGYDSDGLMNWDAAVTWADQLVYGGYDDWRLPTTPGTNEGTISEGEMGHLYYVDGVTPSSPGLFFNLESSFYWSGTEDSANPDDDAWRFGFNNGFQGIATKVLENRAWAVRQGDSAPIPEPTTMLLLGSGLIGLAGLRKKFRKK